MGSPKDLLYTNNHEWAKIEENLATVGITYYAQSHLGEVTFVDLPQIGKEIKQFERLATVEAMKAVVEVQSPLSGRVIKINEELKNSPSLINQSPYNKGWFLVLKCTNLDEKRNLMNSEEYDKFLESTG